MMTLPYFGLSTESANPPVVATTICVNHDPTAITIVFQKYRPTSTSVHALVRLLQANP